MRFKLIEKSGNDYTDIDSLCKNILLTRDVCNVKEYLNILNYGDKYENHYSLLDNIDKAVKCLIKHLENQSKIFIIADCDVDGVTSFSILYMYLKRLKPDIDLSYGIHTGKQHGITKDIQIPDDIDLLIVPDAGSNQLKEHKELKDKGIDIIILDHHEAEEITQDAIIVNNQLCNYPNKQLSGVAIVYKFLQALDDETWNSMADDYLDLVALGLIGDSMKVTEMETKYLIEKGLSKIRNKQFKALIDKQEYSIKGRINSHSVGFYVAPLINAMIRVGKQNEKALMFKGFIEEYDEFDYKPRNKDEMIKEDIYTRVARLCSNTKNRQDKSRDKATKEISEIVLTKNKLDDKIIFVNCNNEYDLGIIGVIAIRIADKFNRPCVLLNKTSDGFGGSGRNTDRNTIKDLKSELNKTGLVCAEGHPQAMGVRIPLGVKVSDVISKLNKQLKDVVFEDFYDVDFIIPFEELEDDFIYTIANLGDVWGRGCSEPLIAITGLEFNESEIEIIGKQSNVLKVVVDDVCFIKFKVNEEDELISNGSDWDDEDDKTFKIDLVGKCTIDSYNNIPQIIIEDYNIVEVR